MRTKFFKFNQKSTFWAICLILAFSIAGRLFALQIADRAVEYPPLSQTEESIVATETSDPTTVSETPEEIPSKPLPTKIHLSVPFVSQAPLFNWDALHEDACEEAGLLIIKHFLFKEQFSSREAADREIIDLVSYEEANGYGPSITLDDLNKIAFAKYNLKGEIKQATIDSIKAELAAGRPVIVGAAGKILPNPNFRNGGPVYHMLVITGYNATQFITNDPGTKHGKDFTYTHDDLLNAIHDWNPTNILDGEKKYLVF